MLHYMYLAEVFYDMYLEVSEYDPGQTWKDDNIFDFWKFCDLLSNQMIKYNPTHHKYPGNTNMRLATQQYQPARDISKDDARGKRGRPQ